MDYEEGNKLYEILKKKNCKEEYKAAHGS